MNKRIILLAVAIIIVFGLIWFWSAPSKEEPVSDAGQSVESQDNSGITLFYGEECPHCKDLEKFIADNGIEQKVSFSQLEVWHDKDNAKILMERVSECQIPEDEVGVPFLYSDGKCLIGGPDIEAFFREKAGI